MIARVAIALRIERSDIALSMLCRARTRNPTSQYCTAGTRMRGPGAAFKSSELYHD